MGREVEVCGKVVDVDVLSRGGNWHPSWQICRQGRWRGLHINYFLFVLRYLRNGLDLNV